ncbi:hypothetical protein LTR94_031792, partial [Friedmanniomyces endolithicus]
GPCARSRRSAGRRPTRLHRPRHPIRPGRLPALRRLGRRGRLSHARSQWRAGRMGPVRCRAHRLRRAGRRALSPLSGRRGRQPAPLPRRGGARRPALADAGAGERYAGGRLAAGQHRRDPARGRDAVAALGRQPRRRAAPLGRRPVGRRQPPPRPARPHPRRP